MSYSIITRADFFDTGVQDISGFIPNNFFDQVSVLKAWWESHRKPLLFSIQFFEQNELIGFLALCTFDGGKTLQFLGDQDVSDYLDIEIKTGYERQVLRELEQCLQELSSWAILTLISLPAHSVLRQALAEFAQNNQWRVQETQQDVCPIIELPPTWEEYLLLIGKKQRHEVTRKWRRLEEQGTVDFRVVTDTQQNPAALETFFRLHRLSSLEKAEFWTAEHEQYFRLLSTLASQHGWLRLYFLDFNGGPAAAMYCFAYQSQLLIYNSGFDPVTYQGKSVGNVLTAYTIQDAISQGFVKYDFLRGGEEYKLRYRAVPKPIFNLELKKANAA